MDDVFDRVLPALGPGGVDVGRELLVLRVAGTDGAGYDVALARLERVIERIEARSPAYAADLAAIRLAIGAN